MVPATKMAVKIAADLLEDRQLPGNVQADELFQQSYVVLCPRRRRRGLSKLYARRQLDERSPA